MNKQIIYVYNKQVLVGDHTLLRDNIYDCAFCCNCCHGAAVTGFLILWDNIYGYV
jgi:hypothetical protein